MDMTRAQKTARWYLPVAGVLAALLAVWCIPAAQAKTSQSSPSVAPAAKASIYLDSVQMTSASTGWALRWTGNPSSVTKAPYLVPARSTDGARQWTTVTPPGASKLLATPYAEVVLHALNGERAWLAVTPATAATQLPMDVHTTQLYVTANGGQTWTKAAPLKVQGFAEFITFTGPEDGWLLEDHGSQNGGAAMQQDYVAIYRTTDGGLRWSLVAQTEAPPGLGVGTSGIPVYCDKAGLQFATPSVGYLVGACNVLSDALRVSRDAGTKWTGQKVPIPADTCNSAGCFISEPEFFGQTGFLTVGHYPATAYFLVSRNLGKNWQRGSIPSGAGVYPRIQFFSANSGIIVSAGVQGVIGSDFYTTADGGKKWTTVPQGRHFTQLGVGFDFVSSQVGFAWVPGTDATGSSAPDMYLTTNSGHTWTAFGPT
jgi:photosystem II stability/assembly factor-like uncharacterized protein